MAIDENAPGKAAGGAPPQEPQENPSDGLTRRELLKRAGIVVGAAAIPAVPVLMTGGTVTPAAIPVQGEAAAQAAAQDEALRSLTRLEYDTLDAICSRIIPSDDNGPGAREARAARYIDWGLAGALNTAGGGARGGRGGAGGGGSMREQYAAALAAIEAHAVASKGASFTALSAEDQDAILAELTQNAVPQAPQGFFNTVRTHTIQGTFSDPFYGGNANCVGWDLIRYPGVRIAVPAEYQQWGVDLQPNHQSAYDSNMFSRGEV